MRSTLFHGTRFHGRVGVPTGTLNVPIRPGARTLIAAVVLAVIGVVAPAAVADAKRPDLKVAKVHLPHPPGTFSGGQLLARSAVANRGEGRARKRSRVGYFLSTDRKHSANDPRLRAPIRHHRVPRLLPGRQRGGEMVAKVPARVEPGIYHLIACADVGDRVKESREGNNCTTARHAITIQGPSAQSGPPGSTPVASNDPPAKEYTPGGASPEHATAGFEISEGFRCPGSTHGQGFPATNAFYTKDTSDCVWVTTPRFDGGAFQRETGPDIHDIKYGVFGLFYCPAAYRYPFLVALGTDPLWEDQSDGMVSNALTGTVSADKYVYSEGATDAKYGDSYAGLGGPVEDPGYVFFRLPGNPSSGAPTRSGRAAYLCSDTPSDLALKNLH
jgi:hypothetical protein